jgi:anaerobic magnesium-protoporphyrin IX monomethyl ester cyclase
MDVLLVEPNDEVSFGLMSIQAVLNENGFSSRILFGESITRILDIVGRERPRVIGISCTTLEFFRAVEIAENIKKDFDVPVVFGGVHPSFFPEIIDRPCIDIVCRGEGEYPMLDLVRALKAGNPITEIENLWVKEGGRVYRNKPRLLIQNLDELPFTDWSDYYEKHPLQKFFNVRQFMVSRGCMFNCSYCFNSLYRRDFGFDGRYFRQHSVDYVIGEIKHMREKYGVSACYFGDDTFGSDKKWLAEFAEKYGKEIALPFSAVFSVKEVDEEIVIKLRDAGLRLVRLAIESSNEKIRNEVLNKRFTTKEYLEKAGILRRHGVKIWTFILHGVITQTEDDFYSDMRFINKSKPYIVENPILVYFPRLPVTEYAEKRGLLVELPPEKQMFPGQKTYPVSHTTYNLYFLFLLGIRWSGFIPLTRLISKIPFTRFLKNPYAFHERFIYWVTYPQFMWFWASVNWTGFYHFIINTIRYYLLKACGVSQRVR